MYLLTLGGLADLGSDMALVLWNEKASVKFNSIQLILCLSDSKGGYDPQDIEHVNSVTPSVYIIICTKQTIK
jgi:hypothetical protein